MPAHGRGPVVLGDAESPWSIGQPRNPIAAPPWNPCAAIKADPVAWADLPTHVPIAPPEGGLSRPSVIMVEQIRSVSTTRLGRRIGAVSPETMSFVDQCLVLVLRL